MILATVSIRLPVDLIDKIDKDCKIKNIDRSTNIRQILDNNFTSLSILESNLAMHHFYVEKIKKQIENIKKKESKEKKKSDMTQKTKENIGKMARKLFSMTNKKNAKSFAKKMYGGKLEDHELEYLQNKLMELFNTN